MNFMATVSIQKTNIEKQKGVVILPIKEYRRLLANAIPTYYLLGKEAEKLDALVEEGLHEYRNGETVDAGFAWKALKKAKRENAKR